MTEYVWPGFFLMSKKILKRYKKTVCILILPPIPCPCRPPHTHVLVYKKTVGSQLFLFGFLSWQPVVWPNTRALATPVKLIDLSAYARVLRVTRWGGGGAAGCFIIVKYTVSKYYFHLNNNPSERCAVVLYTYLTLQCAWIRRVGGFLCHFSGWGTQVKYDYGPHTLLLLLRLLLQWHSIYTIYILRCSRTKHLICNIFHGEPCIQMSSFHI